MSKLAKFGAGTMQVGGQIAAVGKVFYHDSHSTNAMNIIDIIIIIQPWQSGRSGSGGCI